VIRNAEALDKSRDEPIANPAPARASGGSRVTKSIRVLVTRFSVHFATTVDPSLFPALLLFFSAKLGSADIYMYTYIRVVFIASVQLQLADEFQTRHSRRICRRIKSRGKAEADLIMFGVIVRVIAEKHGAFSSGAHLLALFFFQISRYPPRRYAGELDPIVFGEEQASLFLHARVARDRAAYCERDLAISVALARAFPYSWQHFLAWNRFVWNCARHSYTAFCD